MLRVDLPVHQGRVRVVLATTVLLSFISFWRAAAIVLNDLGSTADYIGGISEQAIGKSAPWFVLGVMLFSYTVRALEITGNRARRVGQDVRERAGPAPGRGVGADRQRSRSADARRG